jgi:DNA mismatch repair ATPase MutS
MLVEGPVALRAKNSFHPLVAQHVQSRQAGNDYVKNDVQLEV